ncbi:MAG: DoxX family protein [Bacteroidales bacterium]|nr:DoxX family protein [Bacteroidales bacterium]
MTIFKLPQWGEKIADKKWNHALVWLLRLVLGITFMFSGFAKAIDPWGGAYKFAEYCNVYGFESFASAALGLSFALAALEFMLGVFVFTGSFRRGAPVLLICMMAALLPITLDLALTDRVPHCGCFGDAVVISNWASFWKNVALTIGLIYLTFFNRRVHGIYGPAVNWIVGLISFVFVACVAYNGYFKQPLVDFAQYRVGSKLGVPANIDGDGDNMVFVYKKDGVEKEFSLDSVPDEEDGWEFVERHYKKGMEPKGRVVEQPIAIYDKGVDVTEDVLPDTGRVVMFLFPDLRGVNISYSFDLNEIYAHATKQGIQAFAATSSSDDDIKWWNDISMSAYSIYRMDDSELKSIARGNPAVVYLVNGKLVWKRTLASLDKDKVRVADYPVDQYNSDYNQKKLLSKCEYGFLLALLILLVVNRTHVLVMLFYRLIRKEPKETVSEENPDQEEVVAVETAEASMAVEEVTENQVKESDYSRYVPKQDDATSENSDKE